MCERCVPLKCESSLNFVSEISNFRMAQSLKQAGTLNMACVQAENSIRCAQLIDTNVADATRLTAEEIYVAGRQFNLLPIVSEKWPETGDFADDVIVVIRKDVKSGTDLYPNGLFDLKGKKLCLSGTEKNHLQYEALVNVLLPLGMMEVYNNECHDPLISLWNHFGSSCMPGSWALNKDKKRQYGSLCKLCGGDCSPSDPFAGVDGSLQCLTQGGGDVAITDSQAVARANLDPEIFELLCIQGGKKPVNNSNCLWLARRTPAIVVSPKLPKPVHDGWKSAFQRLFDKYKGVEDNWVKYWSAAVLAASNRTSAKKEPPPDWLGSLLFSRPNITSIADVFYRNVYERYVGELFVRTMETPFPWATCGHPAPLRWCVYLPRHFEKCGEMAMIFATQRLKPALACVKARSAEECQRLIENFGADVTLLRADQMVSASHENNLVPVAMEKYPQGDAALYTVAAIRRGTNLTLTKLSGGRSCHPGADDILGWNAPLTILERRGLVEMPQCDFALAAGNFFWESCVPEIGRYTHVSKASRLRDAELRHSLCSLCGGEDVCDHNSPFAGYDGALKCLDRRGGGNVAFVTNETLLGGGVYSPSEADRRFQLICLDGTIRSVSEYRRCYWLKIPGRLLVVSANKYSAKQRHHIADFFQDIQLKYGSLDGSSTADPEDQSYHDYVGQFSIFSSPADTNSLFGSDTKQLLPVYPEDSLEKLLGEDFYAVYRKIVECSRAPQFANSTAPLATILLLLIVIFN